MNDSQPTRSLGSRILHDTLRVTLASAVAQAVIFVTAAYVAAVFGVSWETDAFYLAFTLPLFAANVVREAIKAVFVPVLVDIKVKTPAQVGPVVGSALFAVAVISCAVGLVLMALAPWALPRVAPQLSPEGAQLAVRMTWELMPILPLMCLTGVLSGLLNAYQHFRLPMLVPGIESALKAGLVFLLVRPLGIHSLALGNVLGALAAMAALWWWVRRLRLPLGEARFHACLHPELKRMGQLALFPLLGNSLLLLNPFVDRTVATQLPAGAITALNYAERINSLPYVLMGAGLFSVILSHWSQMVAEEGPGKLAHALQESLLALVYVLTPMTALLIALRTPLVRLVLERGRFDAAATALTALALGYLALGTIPSYAITLLARGYLVLQDTRTPVLLGLLNAGLNLALDLALVRPFALGGIALSSSLTLFVVAVISIAIMRRRLPGRGEGLDQSRGRLPWLWPCARMALAGAATAWAAHYAYRAAAAALGGQTFLSLAAVTALAGLAGLAAFLAGSLVLGLQEPYKLLRRLRPLPARR